MNNQSGSYRHTGGVAAGMEFDDSGDEFLFGDDDFIDDVEPVKLSKAVERDELKPVQTRRAPWALDKTKKEVATVKVLEEHGTISKDGTLGINRSLVLKLEDEEIRAAISKGDIEYIKEAIQSGLNADNKMKSGWTCLMYSAVAGNSNIMKLLLDKGANPNFHKDTFTPLMALCSSTGQSDSRVICAQQLLDAGARVNVHDRHLVTPLMYAARMGHHQIIKLLIDQKANLDAQDNQGWTALSFAANSGHSYAAKVLLENKALKTLCAYDGQTPADIAYAKGFTTLADILESSNTDLINGQDKLLRPRDVDLTGVDLKIRYKKVEELEMFLHGLDLGYLVEMFQENQITFQEFLQLSDDDLIKIGIVQLGARRKILEAIRGVHTNEWDLSGLTVDKTSKISTIEAAAIIANVAKHLDFVRSSISFLHDYIRTNKESIEKDEPGIQRVLVNQCKAAYTTSCIMQDNLKSLQSFVDKELPLAYKGQCDLIEDSKCTSNTVNRRRFILPFIGSLTLLGIFIYKYCSR